MKTADVEIPEPEVKAPGWADWSDEKRLRFVRLLRKLGKGKDAIAGEFGISRRELGPYWVRAAPDAD